MNVSGTFKRIPPRPSGLRRFIFYTGVVGLLGGVFVRCVRVRTLNPRASLAYVASRTLKGIGRG